MDENKFFIERVIQKVLGHSYDQISFSTVTMQLDNGI